MNTGRDETSVWHKAFDHMSGNLKGLIVDENGLDVLYWRKLEGVDDVGNGFRKEVLDQRKKEQRSSEAVPKGRSSAKYSKSSARVVPESREAIYSLSSNSSSEIQLASRDSSEVFSLPISLSSNPLQRNQPEMRDPDRIFSHPSSNSSNSVNSSTRIQLHPVTSNSNSKLSATSIAAANPEVAAMAKSSTQNSVPKPPPPPAQPPRAPPPPGAGGSKPPPAPPSSTSKDGSKQSMGSQTKLKPLHWDKVVANADHSMVWDKIGGGSFRFDDNLMEALFGYVATNNKSAEINKNTANVGNSNSSQPKQTFLLHPRKSQNTAIVLRSLSLSRQEILDSLLNGNGLNADTLEKLTKIAPTKEEETLILQFNGNPLKLADAESFLYHLFRSVPSPFRRLDAMLFKSTYEPEILQLKESLQILESACKELRKRGLFLKLLEAVLKAGNRMNAGTSRGNAQAFKLSALCKLSDVKSSDGKTTLLHFVVQEVVRSEGKRCVINRNRAFRGSGTNLESPNAVEKEEWEKDYMMLGLPVVGGLSVEFSNAKKAATIDYDGFINACEALTARVNGVRELLGGKNLGGGDGFVREMKGFLDAAEEELMDLKEEQRRVMEVVKRTKEFYQSGASKEKGTHPLQLFIIVRDFLGMVDQVCVNIARSQQQQKKPSPAAKGGSSPPPAEVRATVRFPYLPAHFLSDNSRTSSSDSEDG